MQLFRCRDVASRQNASRDYARAAYAHGDFMRRYRRVPRTRSFRVSATSIAYAYVYRVPTFGIVLQKQRKRSIMVSGVHSDIQFTASTFRIVLNKTDCADVKSMIGAPFETHPLSAVTKLLSEPQYRFEHGPAMRRALRCRVCLCDMTVSAGFAHTHFALRLLIKLSERKEEIIYLYFCLDVNQYLGQFDKKRKYQRNHTLLFLIIFNIIRHTHKLQVRYIFILLITKYLYYNVKNFEYFTYDVKIIKNSLH